MPKASKFQKVTNIDLVLEYLASRMGYNAAVYFKELGVVQRFKKDGKIEPNREYKEDRLATAIKNILADYDKNKPAKRLIPYIEVLKTLIDD